MKSANSRGRARAFLLFFHREWKGNFRSLLLIFSAAALVLYLFARPFLGATESSESGEAHGLPDSLQYDMSIVSEERDLFIKLVQSNLQSLPAVRKVYVEGEERAKERLEAGKTVLYIKFPPQFSQEIRSGKAEEQVEVYLSRHMPKESELLAGFFASAGRALSIFHASLYAYQSLYQEINGELEGSWEKMTQLTFQQMTAVQHRGRFLEIKNTSPYIGPGSFITSVFLLFALLPSVLLVDRRGASLESPFRDRVITAGFDRVLTLAEYAAHLLMAAILLLPPIVLSFIILPGRASRLFSLYGLSLLAAAIGLVWAIGLSNLHLSPQLRAASAWLFVLLLFFTAGGMYPSELMPPFLGRLFALMPMSGTYELMKQTLHMSGDLPNVKDVFTSCLSFLPAAAFYLWTNRRRLNG